MCIGQVFYFHCILKTFGFDIVKPLWKVWHATAHLDRALRRDLFLLTGELEASPLETWFLSLFLLLLLFFQGTALQRFTQLKIWQIKTVRLQTQQLTVQRLIALLHSGNETIWMLLFNKILCVSEVQKIWIANPSMCICHLFLSLLPLQWDNSQTIYYLLSRSG